jgi:predicted membrane protein
VSLEDQRGAERLPAMRASDSERETVVKRLADACGEGRLTLEELLSRVDAAYRATTHAELEPLLVDLPAPTTVSTDLAVPEKKKKRRWVVAVMGEHHRRGHWRLSERTGVFTMMGEAELDLRQAVIETPEIQITMVLLMGEQRVIVPTGIEVEVTGFVFMGSRKVRVADAPLRPGMPRIHIRCYGMMGEVKIQSR